MKFQTGQHVNNVATAEKRGIFEEQFVLFQLSLTGFVAKMWQSLISICESNKQISLCQIRQKILSRLPISNSTP